MALDALKAEIARKRKQAESTLAEVAGGKKFFRRGDLEAVRKEAYLKTQRDKEHSRSSSPQTGSEGKEKKRKQQTFDYTSLPRSEVIRRLRERREPILLFGETEGDACRRLQRLEHDAPEMIEGYRNDLKDAMDKNDQEDLQHILETSAGPSAPGPGKHDIHLSEQSGKTIAEVVAHVAEWLDRNDFSKNCEVILEFYEFIIEQWALELNARDEEEKRTARGRLGKATFTQTTEYVKPLFKNLQRKQVAMDILEHLVNITRCVINRDYVKANNAYMEMAIGNAPWPVGVTASGIHKRPGNEKFWVRNVAHVLNDETQRKYIQALKRLITRCQYYYPADPSKCVEYGAFATEIRGDGEGNG